MSTSNNVYIYISPQGWVPGRVIESTVKTAVVELTPTPHPYLPDDSDDEGDASPGEQFTVNLKDYPSKALPLQNVDEKGNLEEVRDMVDLPYLHEPAILYNLRARHSRAIPYTRTGDIVIAVNPYQWLTSLYTETVRELYAASLIWNARSGEDARKDLEPHVYETSSMAYRGLAVDGKNQSVLVSGESGAGKTETVKILMSHLASVQSANTDAGGGDGMSSVIVKRVLDSNPLLEAFGNAKTIRNDNSSRFGKYIQLQFDVEDPVLAAYSGRSVPSCLLAGSKCVTYLLEKSRVVGHEGDERNYHIFYQLLCAPNDIKKEIWEGLDGKGLDDFKYVGDTETLAIEGKSDGERWQLTVDALAILGVTGDKFLTLCRALAVVLQLGNLVFEPDPANEENSKITSLDEMEQLAPLIGVPVPEVTKALTMRTVKARNEEYEVPLNAVAAKESCDAFAKEIYSQVFDWLVGTINDATCAENNYEHKNDVKKFGVIGLLDIFGFECFLVNRFEQLCINYTNEKLQQKFTLDIFRSVQEEYEFEGISLGEVTFADNVEVLNLVEGRMGLISVLNEECVRPRGNDISFVSKINTMNKDSECLVQDKFYRNYEFGINHYAGLVTYNATHFVSKNKDTLPSDLSTCAVKSTNDLIHSAFKNYGEEDKPSKSSKSKPGGRPGGRRGGLVRPTLWTKFRQQLGSLMNSISETKTRYIRCIKPNTYKKPLLMQQGMTIEQLRCAGVVGAITISRSMFPNRLEHDVALERFSCLAHKVYFANNEEKKTETDDTRKEVDYLFTTLLKSMAITKADGTMAQAFVSGKTRVYFRAGALEYLEAERLSAMGDRAVEMQRIVRGFLHRKKYIKLKAAAIKVQSKARSSTARRRYKRIRNACIELQCWVRQGFAKDVLKEKRRNAMATLIQTHWRMVKAMVYRYTCIQSAIRIQACMRGARQRPIYREELKEWKEASLLENQVKMLQKRLEEAEKRRVEAEKRAEEGKTQTVVVYKESGAAAPAATPAPQAAPAPAPAAKEIFTAQQKTLMDESGKMLEYLRKEVFKLRSQNSQLRTDCDLLKENNQRLMDANASAGASFAALNQHAKQISRTNAKLMADLNQHKQQVSKLNLTQIELKEELKMKQATYIAEVHSRLQYQKTMNRIVDTIQARCHDDRLVEDIITMSDDCESDYMAGPSGISVGAGTPSRSAPSNISPPMRTPPPPPPPARQSSSASSSGRPSMAQGMSSRILSFFGGGGSFISEDEYGEDHTHDSSTMNMSKPGLSGLQAFTGHFSEV